MSEECEVCQNSVEELFDCTSCSIVFCSDCGNTKRNLCNDCEEFINAEDISDMTQN